MMRGLFGKSLPGAISGFGGGTFDLDGAQVTPQQSGITLTPQASEVLQGNAPMPKPQSFWQGGNRFTGRDALAGVLAAIGDGLRGWSGGPTGAVEGLIAGRLAPGQQAAALAAEQRKRAADLADYEAKKGIDARYATPDAPKPGSFEWYQTATPEQRAIYDQYNPVIATTWQGPTPIPRSRLGGVPSAPVGKLTPLGPTIQNTPAPQLNAQGNPTSLSHAQYQAIVAEMGQSQTDDYLRRYNIRVVN